MRLKPPHKLVVLLSYDSQIDVNNCTLSSDGALIYSFRSFIAITQNTITDCLQYNDTNAKALIEIEENSRLQITDTSIIDIESLYVETFLSARTKRYVWFARCLYSRNTFYSHFIANDVAHFTISGSQFIHNFDQKEYDEFIFNLQSSNVSFISSTFVNVSCNFKQNPQDINTNYIRIINCKFKTFTCQRRYFQVFRVADVSIQSSSFEDHSSCAGQMQILNAANVRIANSTFSSYWSVVSIEKPVQYFVTETTQFLTFKSKFSKEDNLISSESKDFIHMGNNLHLLTVDESYVKHQEIAYASSKNVKNSFYQYVDNSLQLSFSEFPVD